MRAWIFLLFAVGCGPSGSLVTVDLWSDLSAGTEVVRARTVFYAVDDGRELLEQNTPLGRSDRLFRGKRVAEVDQLTDGSYRVVVELYDAAGELVMMQRVIVDVRGATSIIVQITRACRGVTCDETEVCLGGECVPPECAAGGCAQCNDASECPATVACGENACTDGFCFQVPREGGCPAGQLCDLDVGCVVDTFDAGPPMGMDAGGPPPECTSRGDCPPDSTTTTGDCTYSSTCAEFGSQPIDRTTWSCDAGMCRSSTTADRQSCTRSTMGDRCGGSSRSCGGACNPVSGDPCEQNGTLSCTLTERICSGGGCTDQSRPDGTEPCTINPDGNACDDGNPCTNPDLCRGTTGCFGPPDCPRSGLCSGGCPIPVCNGSCFSYCDCI